MAPPPISALPPPPPLCTTCSKPTTLTCTACSDAPPSPSATRPPGRIYYCSLRCQREDRAAHQVQCGLLQRRRSLYRAADTGQKLFHTYREFAFDRAFSRVEVDGGGDLHLYEKGAEGDGLVAFPRELFPTEEMRNAALAFDACKVGAGHMVLVMQRLFKGLHSVAREMRCRIQSNNGFQVIMHKPDHSLQNNSRAPHTVIVLTLRGSDPEEKYIFDPSCAQYGYAAPLIPDTTFAQRTIGQTGVFFFASTYHELRMDDSRLKSSCSYGATPSRNGFAHHEAYLRSLNLAMEKWQTTYDDRCGAMSLKRLLRAPEAEFKRGQCALVEYVRDWLLAFREAEKLQGWLRGWERMKVVEAEEEEKDGQEDVQDGTGI